MSTYVTDPATLRALAAAGLIIYPVHPGASYVDSARHGTTFEHAGERYRLRYIDGCFYPYVVKEPTCEPVAEINWELAR